MRKDFLLAVRSLRQSPVFALTAILTIALGIGASTAIFSVTNAVLLRPLPYKDPDRLLLGWVELRARHEYDATNSYDTFADLKAGAPAFEDAAVISTGRGTIPAQDGTLEQVSFGATTPNFFRLLGARVVAGRDFVESDGTPPPPAPNAAPGVPSSAAPTMGIISYEYWRKRHGMNPDVLGHSMGGPNDPIIVGVLEPGFEMLFPPNANVQREPDVWIVPRLRYDPAARNNVGFRMIMRLKPGVSIDQAQSQTDVVSADLRTKYLTQKATDFHVRLEPMKQNIVAEVKPTIIALMGSVIFPWLIACTNVANLLMVRASLKKRELSVRTALGASRWRLMRQMLARVL
jgi:MacB-like periplasmic core domain